MPINSLYITWCQRIQELTPNQRTPQVRNFVWWMTSVYQSRTVCLSRVAGSILRSGKLLSNTRRLSRLLENHAIRVREWYEPIAWQWLEAQFCYLGEICLIVDGTRIGFGYQLLIVSLAYRKRSVPIAWVWIKHVKRHISADQQLALLADFGTSDEAVLDVLFGAAQPEGKLPFELPSSMEAVRNQKTDLPHDSDSPLYPFGFGLSYE